MVGVNFAFVHNPSDAALLKHQGGLCFYCRKPLKLAGATRDHLFPAMAGRGRTLGLNKVMACGECNATKGCRQPTPDEVAKARRIYRSFGLPAFGVPA